LLLVYTRAFADGLAAGKFPTPVSPAEDLNNKLTEVRSTIKFQLKKVLCLGVAVGHVQMSDDQVLGNVMLSTRRTVSAQIVSFIYTRHARHQLPRLAAQEKLAKCQVVAYQVDDGQTYPPLLSVCSYVRTFVTGGEQGVERLCERRESNGGPQCKTRSPARLDQRLSGGWESIGS
jgi:hypothetical protein